MKSIRYGINKFRLYEMRKDCGDEFGESGIDRRSFDRKRESFKRIEEAKETKQIMFRRRRS